MYMIDYSKLFEEFFNEPKTTNYVPNKFAVDIKDESASIALSVLGHDPKDIEIKRIPFLISAFAFLPSKFLPI